MACYRRVLASALGALLCLLSVGPAGAEPALVATATPMGGGLVEYAVSVDFQDGLARSGYIDIDFTGNFSSSQLETAQWPDIQSTLQGSTNVRLQGGTGGGSQVNVVPVASLVVPSDESITYNAVVSRNGQNFVLVPEPGAGGLAAAALATLGLFARRRRTRGTA